MGQNNLKIKTLKIKHQDKDLVDISFDLNSSLALIGESGSGKSLTLKALLGMLPSNLSVEIIYDIGHQNSEHIGYVPQNPFTSLSPLTKIKNHFISKEDRQKELLNLVELPLETLEKFPMQLSGGQLQRVVIALSLEKNPNILLLDEPTTALDSKTKKTILELLKSLHQELGFKILFVTHDINAINDLCDDIIILQNGHICEAGKTKEVLTNPKQKYTKKLIESNFTHREFRN
jgi:peptide/nickel transport system ATP-binding protein